MSANADEHDDSYNPVDDEIHARRADEARRRERNNDAYKKQWARDQANEYKHVSDDKEAVCYGCFRKEPATATLVDICQKCKQKRGGEALLAHVIHKFYGMCYFCGTYDFDLWQINVRLCLRRCNAQVRKHLTNFNMKGGVKGTDPFWLSMRRKHGKDMDFILNGSFKKVRTT